MTTRGPLRRIALSERYKRRAAGTCIHSTASYKSGHMHLESTVSHGGGLGRGIWGLTAAPAIIVFLGVLRVPYCVKKPKSIWSAARQWQGAQKSLASARGGQPSAPKSPLAEKRN